VVEVGYEGGLLPVMVGTASGGGLLVVWMSSSSLLPPTRELVALPAAEGSMPFGSLTPCGRPIPGKRSSYRRPYTYWPSDAGWRLLH
jgi:hypothetical protein